jgi:hypothetical protein
MKNLQNWEKFNEEYSKKDIEKDVKRIEDMKTKSRDDEHMLSLSKTMASRITNYEKAHNRALAAEEQNYHDVAEVFFKRAEELKSESKVSEGVAEKSVRTKDKHTETKADKKDAFRKKVKDLVTSQKDCKVKQTGDDFEIHCCDEHVGQVMFRSDYVGVKKVGNKFPKEFGYEELGKIKAEISSIIKSCK